MTHIAMGSEQYRRLLREWAYWERHAQSRPLTESDARRFTELTLILQKIELASRPVNEVHSEEGSAAA